MGKKKQRTKFVPLVERPDILKEADEIAAKQHQEKMEKHRAEEAAEIAELQEMRKNRAEATLSLQSCKTADEFMCTLGKIDWPSLKLPRSWEDTLRYIRETYKLVFHYRESLELGCSREDLEKDLLRMVIYEWLASVSYKAPMEPKLCVFGDQYHSEEMTHAYRTYMDMEGLQAFANEVECAHKFEEQLFDKYNIDIVHTPFYEKLKSHLRCLVLSHVPERHVKKPDTMAFRMNCVRGFEAVAQEFLDRVVKYNKRFLMNINGNLRVLLTAEIVKKTFGTEVNGGGWKSHVFDDTKDKQELPANTLAIPTCDVSVIFGENGVSIREAVGSMNAGTFLFVPWVYSPYVPHIVLVDKQPRSCDLRTAYERLMRHLVKKGEEMRPDSDEIEWKSCYGFY